MNRRHNHVPLFITRPPHTCVGCAVILAVTCLVSVEAHEPPDQDELAKTMAERARAFLTTLRPPQKSEKSGGEYAVYPFEHPTREQMNYLVPSVFRRQGLPLRFMNDQQQQAALHLLEASLSEEGTHKTEQIRVLEDALTVISKDDPKRFVNDSQAYYFAIYGSPPSAEDETAFDDGDQTIGSWGWRYEGHHTSLHWTITYDSPKKRKVSGAPQFFGAQPSQLVVGSPEWKATVREIFNFHESSVPDSKLEQAVKDYEAGPDNVSPEKKARRVRMQAMTSSNMDVLGPEENIARELIALILPDESKSKLAYIRAPFDIETNDVRDAKSERRPEPFDNRGLAYTAMSPKQKQKLEDLLAVYTSVQSKLVAKTRTDKVATDLANKENPVRFCYMGGRLAKPGETLYYRIRGATFEVNYHNEAYDSRNLPDPRLRVHRHAVWRDFTGDWGRDLLLEHLKSHHHGDYQRLFKGSASPKRESIGD